MESWSRSIIAATLVILIGGSLSIAAAQAAGPPASSDRLNVLLIVSDDQQHDAMGCAGNPIVKTPNLDHLARTGVRFTHAFVTIPICTPSRAAYLSGRFGASNGVTFFGQRLVADTPTWAGVLAGQGYQTAITGKWHNVRGFDEYGFDWSANVFMAGMGPSYDDLPMIQRPGDKPKVVKGQITEVITDAALRFLRERDTNRPFFLNVAYTAPHDPRMPPEEYERMYDPDKIPLPANFKPVPEPDPGTLGIRDEKLLPVPRDPAAIRRETAKYYGLITHMDGQIGRLLDALDASGLAGNTIVVFASDNGLTLGAHGLLGKQTLHEEGVRVALIMRHPRLGVAAATRDALVYLLDMMPTVCEWTGTPIPSNVQGRSLADVYTGKAAGVRDAVFGRYDEREDQMFRSIRTDRYKLIQYLKLGREQLFDLVKDPHELNDLADDPALAGVRRQLHDRLTAWRAEQDQAETKWRKPASQRTPTQE
ncbi:MAG: sulfatase-like hydrolase/transferase [Planctomycetes bacterium]|nr:sulfatase-like hydrolase/transferase [Planctomycetota bacterium]